MHFEILGLDCVTFMVPGPEKVWFTIFANTICSGELYPFKSFKCKICRIVKFPHHNFMDTWGVKIWVFGMLNQFLRSQNSIKCKKNFDFAFKF